MFLCRSSCLGLEGCFLGLRLGVIEPERIINGDHSGSEIRYVARRYDGESCSSASGRDHEIGAVIAESALRGPTRAVPDRWHDSALCKAPVPGQTRSLRASAKPGSRRRACRCNAELYAPMLIEDAEKQSVVRCRSTPHGPHGIALPPAQLGQVTVSIKKIRVS